MYCKKCGIKNADEARFCKICGTPLSTTTLASSVFSNTATAASATTPTFAAENEPQPKKKESSRKLFTAVGILLIVLATFTAMIIIILNDQKEKRYEENLKAGHRYLEDEDYEKAAACFNDAIEIDPKQTEPYIGMADIYLVQEEYGKAEKILELAENAADSKSIQKNAVKIANIKKTIRTKKEEASSMANFTWVTEPEIEADDIYYTAMGDDGKHSLNEIYRQFMSPYAIIRKGNSYGLIDLDENMKGGMDYKSITGWNEQYLLERTEPKYEDIYQNNWTLYYLDTDQEDQIIPAERLGCGVGFYAYYYSNGLQLAETYLSPQGSLTSAIPLKQLNDILGEDELFEYNWLETLPGSYGIYHNQMVSEFIYDECGSASEGLLAVCQDGKWGYVNEDGETIIPMEYGPNWKQFIPLNGSLDPNTTKDYCYAASNGYVTLCKDDQWELRDLKGNTVISPGIFEKICPVYEDRCWVKKDGKWGVIELTINTEDTNPDEKDKENEQPTDKLMDQTAFQEAVNMEHVLHYLVDDYDGDGTNEAFGITGFVSEGFASEVKIYFVSSDNQITLLKEDTYGNFNGSYESKPNKFIAWEEHANGSGSISYIYGVKNGNAYEPQISGKYGGFGEENGKFWGYTSDFSQGFHDYIYSYFEFDERTKEFKSYLE